MKYLGIIPARYASSRFPGKPLVEIEGKTMIQRVYEQAKKALNDVCVATDDARIASCVRDFGGEVVMTSPEHPSGTDRCYEAANTIMHQTASKFDVIINIQGDEPFLDPSQIQALQGCFEEKETDIATLLKKISNEEELFSENVTKAIIGLHHFALYFSRAPLPHCRGIAKDKWLQQHTYYKHIGIYAYRLPILEKICQLAPSSLEKAESLEQNRWLENGFRIKTTNTEIESIAVDTPDDLIKINNRRSHNNNS